MTKITIFLVLIAVVSYLLGGINGAIVTSLNLFRRDVRHFGSGNAGLTNFTRTFGTASAPLVLVVDILKTVVSVLFGGWLLGLVGLPLIGRIFAGFCVELGHVYPVYYRFKGGKAALCGGILAWMIDWRIGLICWVLFAVIVIFTRYVSLGSILGAATLPVFMLIFEHDGLECLLALLCALLIIFAHRENILRLIKGEESKLNIGNNSRR